MPRIVMLRLSIPAIIVAVSALAIPSFGVATDEDIAVVDDVHQQVSRRFTDFVDQIDEFFGGDLELDQANESWARLRLDTFALENEDTEFNANVKFKLVLPSTERRLRLLLSTEEEDTRDPAEQVGSNPRLNQDSGNVSLALRFLRTLREDSGVKFDVGARIRDDEAQTFGRIGAFVRFAVNEQWTATLSNNAVYYSRSGFDDQLTLKLDRFLNSQRSRLLQVSTRLEWSEGNRGAGVGQRFGYYHQINASTSAAVEFDLNALTSPPEGKKRLREGEFRLRLRQNIWRPWFYYELIPIVNWPAERDYTGLYGGTVRVEVIFGHVN